MRADAILATPNVTPSSLANDPTEIAGDPTPVDLAPGGLAPIDLVRRNVVGSLFGDPRPVAQVGRFQVQRMIGAGGMGVVHAAYDPQLDRTVALKLLQPLASGELARQRLLREAQAMARLQNPHVIGVYEAGIHGDQVYIAMEFVEEGTFADWLRVRPRAWGEVVDVLIQAGEGLAAAHEAGLVHRDFKPANILFGGGRARISDFGLARAELVGEELERTVEDAGLLLASPLTRTGALLGTPAYMAPEQIRGEPASAVSDQFAFGVVLYESLCGCRPFRGGSVAALLAAIEQGQVLQPPRTAALPSAVLVVIRRALAPEPSRRFPDMHALLVALRSARQTRRFGVMPGAVGWSALLAGAVGLAMFSQPEVPADDAAAPVGMSALLAGGVGLAMFSQPEVRADDAAPAVVAAASPASCDSDALAGVWDAERRGALERMLAGTAASPVVASLDDYAEAWRVQHRARCGEGVHPSRWTDTCLADRQTALGDLVQAITGAPPKLQLHAPAALELLPALADCAAPSRYDALVSESEPATRARIWRLRLALADTFLPRATTHAPREYSDSRILQDIIGKFDPRSTLEMGFAVAVAGIHSEPVTSVQRPGVVEVRASPADALPRLVDIGADAAEAGFADLAARAWSLAAELLESGPHTDDARTRAWSQAEQALAKLPEQHPLWLRLQRDLAYIELAHARHVTAPGACTGGQSDFTSCAAIFSATRRLTRIADDAAATPTDHELLARAHEHAGDVPAAAAARTRGGPVVLDERALGYLDFGAATVVAGHMDLAASLRCDHAGTTCEVDRDFAALLAKDVGPLLGVARFMASSKDGELRGHKMFALSSGGLSLLGCKNGDMIVAVDGQLPEADGLQPALASIFVRGAGTLSFERKGERFERRIIVR
jgi:hypothetical protein